VTQGSRAHNLIAETVFSGGAAGVWLPAQCRSRKGAMSRSVGKKIEELRVSKLSSAPADGTGGERVRVARLWRKEGGRTGVRCAARELTVLILPLRG